MFDISAKGMKFIRDLEGCVLHTYKDVAGYDTIGVGHLIKPGEHFPATITYDDALELLDQDLHPFVLNLNKVVKVPLNAKQADALISLSFNIGRGAFNKSTLLMALNQGEYKIAADQFLVWRYAAHKEVQGLLNRRVQERELFLAPEHGDQGYITGYI